MCIAMDIFTVYLGNECHMCTSNGSLVTAMKMKANEIVFTIPTLLFYIQITLLCIVHIFKVLLPQLISGCVRLIGDIVTLASHTRLFVML
jgi:hypothetical protein